MYLYINNKQGFFWKFLNLAFWFLKLQPISLLATRVATIVSINDEIGIENTFKHFSGSAQYFLKWVSFDTQNGYRSMNDTDTFWTTFFNGKPGFYSKNSKLTLVLVLSDSNF